MLRRRGIGYTAVTAAITAAIAVTSAIAVHAGFPLPNGGAAAQAAFVIDFHNYARHAMRPVPPPIPRPGEKPGEATAAAANAPTNNNNNNNSHQLEQQQAMLALRHRALAQRKLEAQLREQTARELHEQQQNLRRGVAR